MLLLGEGSEGTDRYNKYDKIRPHSIRSLQFDQKVRPLSFRPEKFDLFTATPEIFVAQMAGDETSLPRPSGILERGRKWTSKFVRKPTRDSEAHSFFQTIGITSRVPFLSGVVVLASPVNPNIPKQKRAQSQSENQTKSVSCNICENEVSEGVCCDGCENWTQMYFSSQSAS